MKKPDVRGKATVRLLCLDHYINYRMLSLCVFIGGQPHLCNMATFYFYCSFCNHNTASRSGERKSTHVVVNVGSKRAMPHEHMQAGENTFTRGALIANTDDLIETYSVPGEVGLTLSRRPSQCQSGQEAHCPHPVLHPAVLQDREKTGEEKRRQEGESRGGEMQGWKGRDKEEEGRDGWGRRLWGKRGEKVNENGGQKAVWYRLSGENNINCAVTLTASQKTMYIQLGVQCATYSHPEFLLFNR